MPHAWRFLRLFAVAVCLSVAIPAAAATYYVPRHLRSVQVGDVAVVPVDGHGQARRANVGSIAHNAVASNWREAGTAVTVDLTSWKHLLVSGTNVLAIQVHNDDSASSDLSMIPALSIER